MKVDISVIILSWDDRQHLEECLESLSSGSKSHTMEVIVVDNASTDGSPEMVENKFPRAKLIRNRENLGFSKGNNIGVKASQGRYVCLLNSDTIVLDNCLEALADHLDQNPKIGMIGPKILNADRTHQSSCREFPNWWNNFCSAAGLANIFRDSEFFSAEHMFYFKGDRTMDVDVLVGCFWMARREALDDYGLLDEDFFMYGEDVDWCRRCWKSGWRVTFFHEAQAIHYRGGSSAKKDVVWVEVTQQRSLLRYWEKHHGLRGRLGMSCLLFVHWTIRWGEASINYVIRPSRRKDNWTRMRVSLGCLRDLFTTGCRAGIYGIESGRVREALLDG
jgi:GT2 family glycosyltransferase